MEGSLKGEMDNRYHVYILELEDGSYYVGHTDHLPRRMDQHQSGKSIQTTARLQPERCSYYETFSDLPSALAREKQIKGWTRRKKKALIDGRVDLLRLYSKKGCRKEAV
jgi:putative endonuclease